MTATPTDLIRLEQVSMQFDDHRVLHGIDLGIRRGQTVCVIGESGCGKTVLLKLLIGLLRPTIGRVVFDGQVLSELGERELTKQRLRFGFLFQGAALFDSLTVYDNIAFGLRIHGKRPEAEIGEIVRQRLLEVGLPPTVVTKKPAELSGGMKKRVGLARALALDPEVMLYDEPTTGLDPIMTDVINELILQTRRQHPVTSVIVTHEMKTVYKVADRVVMLYPLSRLTPGENQMLFDGTPDELSRCPETRVRQFIEGEARERLQELARATEQEEPMTTEQRRLMALGIFAVLALILLAALIVMFGSLPTLFKRTNAYTVAFTDAPGLRAGSPVRRSGVRVGEVKDLVLDDTTGKVNVHIELDKNFTVRENERPTLIISLLGSDASIDFIPNEKDPDRSVVPPGSVIEGYSPISVNALLNRASEVVPTTQETLNDMRKSLKRLEEMAPLMEATLKEYRDLGKSANAQFPDLAKSLKSSSDEVGATAREYRKLGESANAQFPDLAKSIKSSSDDFGAASREWRKLGENFNVLLLTNQDKLVKALDNVNLILDRVLSVLSDANIKNVTAIIQNLRDVSSRAIGIAKNTQDASEYFPSIAKNTDELIKESRQTLKRLQTTLDKTDAAMSDLQKLSQSFGERGPSISRNLDESLDKLNRTMTDVRELMRVIGQSDGTLKRLLTDPSLYNNVDQTACAIAKLMPRLDRILKDLETFADKLARHPELIGVPGIINKSNGLKDPEPVNPQHPPH